MRKITSVEEREIHLKTWIERNIGPISRIEIQPRWRPAWAVDVERDGKLLPLYVKGARDDMHAVVPVELEGAALRILNENGVPAPRQFGYCPEADAIVMERLPGESRLEFIADTAVRDRVVDQYVAAMVKFHALDPELFLAAGFKRPETPTDLRLVQFNKTEQMYLAKKRAPEPCNEFLRLWVRRNVPIDDVKPSFITGDAFQMIYHEGRLMGVMDLEMAFIGDPLIDLSCVGMRDLGEKTGDVAKIVQRYRELSGRSLDSKTLRFHLTAFSVSSSMLISDVLFTPSPDTDYFEYVVYYHGSLRIALEALAGFLGEALEELPEPQAAGTPDRIHLAMLAAMTEQVPAATDADAYRRAKIQAEITYLRRRDDFGRAFDDAYLNDAATVLGHRPANVDEAEAKLEAFVHAAGHEWDVRLLRLFYRQAQRQCLLADIPQNRQRLHRFLREPIAPLD